MQALGDDKHLGGVTGQHLEVLCPSCSLTSVLPFTKTTVSPTDVLSPCPSDNGKEPRTDKNQQCKSKGKLLGHFSECLGKDVSKMG